MITIKLLGPLADLFIPELRAEVGSVAEAIACLRANFPAFVSYLYEAAQQGVGYHIKVGYQEIGEEDLASPIARRVRSITISPVPQGAGTFGKIIAGVALIGLGLTGVGFLGISSTSLILTGGAMVLGGISSLFGRVKAPEDDEKDGKRSLVFGGPSTTVREGGRVPIIYGVALTGLYIISARIRSYITV